VLLLVGLVCVILAALLTTAMMLCARGSLSCRAFRQADVVRLVVDAAGRGLPREDDMGFSDLGRLGVSDKQVDKWAKGFRVAYVKTVEDPDLDDAAGGQTLAIRLVPLAETGSEKWARALEVDMLQQERPSDTRWTRFWRWRRRKHE
jgi:hypothetical protein